MKVVFLNTDKTSAKVAHSTNPKAGHKASFRELVRMYRERIRNTPIKPKKNDAVAP